MRSLDMLQKVNVQQCGGWGGSSLNCKCPIPQNAAFRLLILEQLPEAKVCLNGRGNKYKEKKDWSREKETSRRRCSHLFSMFHYLTTF